MILASVVSVVGACVATYIVLRFLPRFGFVDVPNERSSHDTPTATLGGAGLMIGFLSGCFVYTITVGAPWDTWGLGAIVIVLAIFARDELRPMGRLAKLGVQTVAALIAIHVMGPLQVVSLPGGVELDLGWMGPAITWFLYVAGQNLYNFMDGIDGLAGTEGVLAAAGFGVVMWMGGSSYAPMAVLLACASLGFLIWNLPTARVFMGDVGGHLLGLVLCTLAVVAQREGIPIWLSGAIMGTFVFDSVYTILRRALKGENVTMAHRFHLYQRLVRMGWSHLAVVFVYGLHTIALTTGAVLVVAGYFTHGYSLVGLGLLSFAISTVAIERRWSREAV